MDTPLLILLITFGISVLLALELIAIFTRVKRNLTLRVWAGFTILYALIVFAGNIATGGEGNVPGSKKALSDGVCAGQALVILYLISVIYALNFFITFNVWSAVCSTKFRDRESRRFPIYLTSSLIVAAIPTAVVAYFNIQKMNSAVPVMVPVPVPGAPAGTTVMMPIIPEPGFAFLGSYCQPVYPVKSFIYGPMWYNGLSTLACVAMILHAGGKLIVYRSQMSTNNESTSGGVGKSSRGGTSPNSSATISKAMCVRFGVWVVVFLVVVVIANWKYVEAVANNKFMTADPRHIPVTFYAGAILGLAAYLVFGTGRAAFMASTPYAIYKHFTNRSSRSSTTSGRRPSNFSTSSYNPTSSTIHNTRVNTKAVENDGYDMRAYYLDQSAKSGGAARETYGVTREQDGLSYPAVAAARQYPVYDYTNDEQEYYAPSQVASPHQDGYNDYPRYTNNGSQQHLTRATTPATTTNATNVSYYDDVYDSQSTTAFHNPTPNPSNRSIRSPTPVRSNTGNASELAYMTTGPAYGYTSPTSVSQSARGGSERGGGYGSERGGSERGGRAQYGVARESEDGAYGQGGYSQQGQGYGQGGYGYGR
ncbi:uncharacterized protein EV422DRAFT_208508 [Fimicolochytrium jonesii]|uniref:uncharacterized protein n=1 Tax=Fimicolochytrium jonesii TaxID=1396493 RepID=UPI0022FDE198|nr:uncharacterized protein EV422DRAFT_208508 [Fimicolochytrium jonesii]KAI8817857.1 hypothetical protein EV422DRAFT_208508 [Fimicolochytrium jonesii]